MASSNEPTAATKGKKESEQGWQQRTDCSIAEE
jgi:hypothetical protein